MSSLCTGLCETVSQCLSTPQTLCWLTTAAPTVRERTDAYDFSKNLHNLCFRVTYSSLYVYLASPGLYVPHVRGVGLESDHSGKFHIFSEELHRTENRVILLYESHSRVKPISHFLRQLITQLRQHNERKKCLSFSFLNGL